MFEEYALTTFDNPFDPFEQFNSWFLFDEEKGYHSCSYLARIAKTSNQLSEEQNNKEIERAIDEIIQYDYRNIYKKVKAPEKVANEDEAYVLAALKDENESSKNEKEL